MAAETIRCLCAKCQAFTEHTIPGGKCTVCDAPMPTGENIARMGDVPRETVLDDALANKLADLSERYCTPEDEREADAIEPVPLSPGFVDKVMARIQPDRLRELVSAARLIAYPGGRISHVDIARFKAAVDAWDDLEV